MGFMVLGVITDLAASEFEEQVFQIGWAVQGAQRAFAQGGQQRAGVAGVEKHGLAAHLHPAGQRAQRGVCFV